MYPIFKVYLLAVGIQKIVPINFSSKCIRLTRFVYVIFIQKERTVFRHSIVRSSNHEFIVQAIVVKCCSCWRYYVVQKAPVDIERKPWCLVPIKWPPCETIHSQRDWSTVPSRNWSLSSPSPGQNETQVQIIDAWRQNWKPRRIYFWVRSLNGIRGNVYEESIFLFLTLQLFRPIFGNSILSKNPPRWCDICWRSVEHSTLQPACSLGCNGSMMTSSNGNIFRVTGHLCGEFTVSALLAICAGNSPVTGEFPAQRPVTRSFDVFFDLRSSKQSWGWWFETPSCPLWRHSNVHCIVDLTGGSASR